MITGCVPTNKTSMKKVPGEAQRIKDLKALMTQAICRVYVNNRFSGTGSLIREDLVITAAHLFTGKRIPTPPGTTKNAMPVEVLFVAHPIGVRMPPKVSDNKIPAVLIMLNQKLDLAILSIPKTVRTPIKRLAKKCMVGEKIFAPSFKHGKNLILPFGTIVKINDTGVIYNASAGGGSSGAPIVNMKGELVGLCKGPVKTYKIMLSNYKTLKDWFGKIDKNLRKIMR